MLHSRGPAAADMVGDDGYLDDEQGAAGAAGSNPYDAIVQRTTQELINLASDPATSSIEGREAERRYEEYRKLIADPKEVRRQRAEEGKATKKGGGELEKNGDA